MSTDTLRRGKPKSTAVRHRGALLFFLAPFGVLFTLFYIVPILYAVYRFPLPYSRLGLGPVTPGIRRAMMSMAGFTVQVSCSYPKRGSLYVERGDLAADRGFAV